MSEISESAERTLLDRLSVYSMRATGDGFLVSKTTSEGREVQMFIPPGEARKIVETHTRLAERIAELLPGALVNQVTNRIARELRTAYESGAAQDHTDSKSKPEEASPQPTA